MDKITENTDQTLASIDEPTGFMDGHNRREFVVAASIGTSSLIIGCKAKSPSESGAKFFQNKNRKTDDRVYLENYIEVTRTGKIIVVVDRTEMGQGIMTGFASIVGGELGIHPDYIGVKSAPVQPVIYRNKFYNFQLTGGSTSTSSSWLSLRKAAAYTRSVLLDAAGSFWAGGATSNFEFTVDGKIKDKRTSKIIQLSDPELWKRISFTGVFPKLKKEPTIFRRPAKRKFIEEIVQGKPIYSIDLTDEKPLYASIIRCPFPQGSMGVNQVREMSPTGGFPVILKLPALRFNSDPSPDDVDRVAVVHETYWEAFRFRQEIEKKVSWNPKEGQQPVNSPSLEKHYNAEVSGNRQTGSTYNKGRKPGAPALEKTYTAPFLPHQTMEPFNCIAKASSSLCEIWVGTQFIPGAFKTAQLLTGLQGNVLIPDKSDIKVHNTMMGGGFGRKGSHEHVASAIQVSMKMGGRAIKVVWSREEDMQHDHFRPLSVNRIRGFVSGSTLTGVEHRVAAQSLFSDSITNSYLSRGIVPSPLLNGAGGKLLKRIRNILRNVDIDDPFAVEGLKDIAYDAGFERVEYLPQNIAVRAGFIRSIGYSQNIYFLESFIDELANKVRVDPLQFRLKNIKGGSDSRLHNVTSQLKNARFSRGAGRGEVEGIGYAQFRFTPAVLSEITAVAENSGILDFAFRKIFQKDVEEILGKVHSYCAVAVKVAINPKTDIDSNGKKLGRRLRILEVICSLDCGYIINEDIVRQQIEGGIIFAMGAALKQKITFTNSIADQKNFGSCDPLRMNESPKIQVLLTNHRNPKVNPSGVGEVVVPVVAPAICNAIFAATKLEKDRIRKLPILDATDLWLGSSGV